MGGALSLFTGGAVIAATVGIAAAQPRSATLTITPACATVIDAGDVLVALRVELGSIGVGSVTAGGTADLALAVDCPGGGAVVVAYGDRRAEIALDDVAVPARPRVLALALSERLRPSAAPAPAVVVTAPTPAPRARPWELALRFDGVFAAPVDALHVNLGVARRFGPAVRIEAAVGFITGSGSAGSVTGVAGEARVALRLFEVGRASLALGGSLLAARVTGDATATESSTAVRAEARLYVRLTPRLSLLVAGGVGRAIRGTETFSTLSAGAVVGL